MPPGPLIECGLAETRKKQNSHSSSKCSATVCVTVVNMCGDVFVIKWHSDVLVKVGVRGGVTPSGCSQVGVDDKNINVVEHLYEMHGTKKEV